MKAWLTRPEMQAQRSLPDLALPASHVAADTVKRRMAVSIHDVSPAFEDAIERLIGIAAPAIGETRLSMLVVPHHWQGGSIHAGEPFARRLRNWSDLGVEMILHGWSHRDDTTHEGWHNRLRARHMTASEGEFLGLPYHEARQRLQQGRTLLQEIIGKPVAAFVAPAWLYGKGTREALADCGFTIAEDHMRVWNPATGERLASGPVISWASRSRSRIASSLAFARITPALLAHHKLVRIALHPGDVTVPSLIRSIDRTVRHFASRREAVRYAEL